jgi:TrmH family RNA methyltransferase
MADAQCVGHFVFTILYPASSTGVPASAFSSLGWAILCSMLSAAARSRLTIVMVGARNPANIGAAARAMHDFGFSDLRIANEFAPPLEAAQLEATKSAVSAQHILSSARRFDTLAEAIADCTFIAGTTAIGERELTQPIFPLQQAAPLILAELTGAPFMEQSSRDMSGKEEFPQSRVALLFGSEKTGLTNDHLSHCSLLTTIPLFAPEQSRHLSMNLGQSVAVCLYELTRAGFEGARELPALHEASATEQDRELLTQLLLEVMQSTGYTRRYPHNAAAPFVRRLVQQLGRTHREAMTWMGILRQVQWRETDER